MIQQGHASQSPTEFRDVSKGRNLVWDAPSVFRSEGARGGRLASPSHALGWDSTLLHADYDGKCRHLLFLPSQATALLSRKKGSLVKYAKVLDSGSMERGRQGRSHSHSSQDSGLTPSHVCCNTVRSCPRKRRRFAAARSTTTEKTEQLEMSEGNNQGDFNSRKDTHQSEVLSKHHSLARR